MIVESKLEFSQPTITLHTPVCSLDPRDVDSHQVGEDQSLDDSWEQPQPLSVLTRASLLFVAKDLSSGVRLPAFALRSSTGRAHDLGKLYKLSKPAL